MPVQRHFVLRNSNLLLNLPHRLQKLSAGLIRSQAPQPLCCRQFQIATHPVHQKTGLLDELRISSRNRFHMDIAMKMIHCAQPQNCLIDQLHRIRRIPVNGRTEEQTFYIVSTIKTHGQCTYLVRAECRPLCIITDSVDTINTVIAAVISQQDLQQRNASSVCRKTMTDTTGHCIACSHAAILLVHAGRSAGRIVLGCISQNTQFLIQMTVPYRLHVLPPFQKTYVPIHFSTYVRVCKHMFSKICLDLFS